MKITIYGCSGSTAIDRGAALITAHSDKAGSAARCHCLFISDLDGACMGAR
jgi:hypothetical protein